MSSLKQLVPILLREPALRFIARITPVFILILAACSPAVVPASPNEVQSTSVEALTAPTLAPITEVTPLPTSSPEPALIYPYYLPLAIKPDIAPQTVNGVTVEIDWAYVDESRVALHYTISGLDWPDGTFWDSMQARITSPALPDDAFSGAGGWDHGPVDDGVITGTDDQLFRDGAVDAEKHPEVELRVDIPVEGATSVGTFHFAFPAPVLDGIRLEHLDQTVVANNISMTLKTLVLNPSHAEALLCFQMPSPVDWGLTASTITVGGREYSFSGGGIVQGADGKGFLLTDPERCISIGFDIPYEESTSSITLTVPKLLGSVPEVVTAERVDMANQRLAEHGIQMDYVNVDHGGNIEILKRPQDMPDGEIYPLIWDALAEQYEGPWVFTIPIER
jgi:hypothetical protein